MNTRHSFFLLYTRVRLLVPNSWRNVNHVMLRQAYGMLHIDLINMLVDLVDLINKAAI
jgi:hypothetical protein